MKINDLSYSATGTGTRYGYNGTHEQDKELNADGNYLDFGNFGYDTRVAMRRNQEPLRAKYPNLSNYSIFNSNPIFYKNMEVLDWGTDVAFAFAGFKVGGLKGFAVSTGLTIAKWLFVDFYIKDRLELFKTAQPLYTPTRGTFILEKDGSLTPLFPTDATQTYQW